MITLKLKDIFLKNRTYPIFVFISYSTEDREIAGRIKYVLENYWNFSVFLAHEDLEPSIEWEQEILRNLENCEVFLPLITNNYTTSTWTDQESGIAFVKTKVILPISLENIMPYGFIKRYQALRCVGNTEPLYIARQVIDTLEKQGFRERIFEGAIIGLENSSSFDMTRTLVRFLNDRIDMLRKEHYTRIKKARKANIDVRAEIYQMPNFIKKIDERFSSSIYRRIFRLFNK